MSLPSFFALFFFFFKQKTAYEIVSGDWSSDVCSSDLGLHCQGMTMPDAIRLFESVGYMTELPATREATRGAWDPMYLNYTLGKLLILELRSEMQRRPGYTLKTFHDA